MKVSVLISSRNRFDVLSRCLQSVFLQDYPDFEVVVLDDASDEMDLCYEVTKIFNNPRLKCMRSNNQLGVAGGRNRLMLEARGDIFCFIDDDAYFENSNAITRFVSVFRACKDVGIVACKVLNHSGGNTDLLVPFPKILRRRKPDITGQAQYVSYYLGTCHAIRREVVEQCGMYADELMFGEEELDLSYRAIGAGYSIYYEPSIVVHHCPQPSVVKDVKHGHSLELYYHVRNRLYIAYRYLPAKYIPIYLSIWLVRYFLGSLQSKNLGYFFGGLYDGLKRLKNFARTPINDRTIQYLRKHYGRLWY